MARSHSDVMFHTPVLSHCLVRRRRRQQLGRGRGRQGTLPVWQRAAAAAGGPRVQQQRPGVAVPSRSCRPVSRSCPCGSPGRRLSTPGCLRNTTDASADTLASVRMMMMMMIWAWIHSHFSNNSYNLTFQMPHSSNTRNR